MTNLDSSKVKGLCALIEACGKANVAEFSLDSLKISFLSGHQGLFPLTSPEIDLNNSPRSVPLDTSSQEELSREEKLEQLKLTDPVAFEEMVEIE